MSLAGLRDRQNAEWHAWAERNPAAAREHSLRRQQRYQSETVPHAHRDGERWTEEEFAEAMSDRPVRETALMLGRSYKSVIRARQRVRAIFGADGSSLLPTDHPYGGVSEWGNSIEGEQQ